MIPWLHRAALAATVLALGCRKAGAPMPMDATGSSSPRVAAPDTRERDARAVLDRWLGAQNEGDFDRYQAVYARKFHGVRRSGPRELRFDRAGWLADRERMFRKPMTVALAVTTMKAAGTAMNVLATQTWESGTYRDVGPKRFLLVPEDGAWRIAQEEMLSSRKETSALAAAGKVLFVWSGQPVLSEDVRGIDVAGEPRLAAGWTARVRIDESGLPDDVRRWRNEKIVMIDADGGTCATRIVGFELGAGAVWHFGSVQEWESGRVRDGAIAREIWEGGKQMLLAKLGTLEGSCEDPLVARVAASDAPALETHRFEEADRPAAAAAGADLSRLLDRRRVSAADRRGETLVWSVALPPARGLRVLTHAPEACTSDTGNVDLMMIWAVREEGTRAVLSQLASEEGSGDRAARVAADLDGDGQLEIVFTGFTTRAGVLTLIDGRYQVVGSLSIPFYDCGC